MQHHEGLGYKRTSFAKYLKLGASVKTNEYRGSSSRSNGNSNKMYQFVNLRSCLDWDTNLGMLLVFLSYCSLSLLSILRTLSFLLYYLMMI